MIYFIFILIMLIYYIPIKQFKKKYKQNKSFSDKNKQTLYFKKEKVAKYVNLINKGYI